MVEKQHIKISGDLAYTTIKTWLGTNEADVIIPDRFFPASIFHSRLNNRITMQPSGKYCGIHKDINGGMTAVGKIIRDAQVFGLLEETETCENWDLARLYALLDKINTEWDKYGCMVSQLPEDLFERHQRIHNEAIAKAEAAGWSGEDETDSDSSDT